MLKKQFRTVMTFLLVITLVMPFFITSVNAAYENTYYNTGNMREDIIGVALTETAGIFALVIAIMLLFANPLL